MASEDDSARTARAFALARVPDLRCDDIPATPDRLQPMRHELAGWAATVGLTADQIDAVILAGDEAMSNVISHAYPHHTGTFDLHAVHRPDLGTVRITVRDRGRWQPVRANPGPLHGRGLLLMRSLANEVKFDHAANGTTVQMTWLLP